MDPLTIPGTWALLILLAVMVIAFVVISITARVRPPITHDRKGLPRCGQCGYPTVGLARDECPECGASLRESADVLSHDATRSS